MSHKCKLCPRTFSNGRALGGHMRSHLATLPPTNKKTEHPLQLGTQTESDSSSTRSENPLPFYGLRENPKKSSKASDPEFLDAAGSIVQDRESETESTQNPTRRKRSKRVTGSHHPNEITESKRVKSESTTESNPVSSVSDPSQDEEVALCLMMLSRDVWMKEKIVEENDSAELTRRASFKCLGCKRKFKTNKALAGHKGCSKECKFEERDCEDQKIYECPFCYKVFGSGQALGGHKRSHLLGSSSKIISTNLASNHVNDGGDTNYNDNSIIIIASNVVDKVGDTTSFILDLNLPAPIEDDEEYS